MVVLVMAIFCITNIVMKFMETLFRHFCFMGGRDYTALIFVCKMEELVLFYSRRLVCSIRLRLFSLYSSCITRFFFTSDRDHRIKGSLLRQRLSFGRLARFSAGFKAIAFRTTRYRPIESVLGLSLICLAIFEVAVDFSGE